MLWTHRSVVASLFWLSAVPDHFIITSGCILISSKVSSSHTFLFKNYHEYSQMFLFQVNFNFGSKIILNSVKCPLISIYLINFLLISLTPRIIWYVFVFVFRVFGFFIFLLLRSNFIALWSVIYFILFYFWG